MKIKYHLLSALCTLTMAIAQVAVNSTCYLRFYQDELSPQLNSLRKYHEE
jgi:cyclic lactone autoinducer peptide